MSNCNFPNLPFSLVPTLPGMMSIGDIAALLALLTGALPTLTFALTLPACPLDD
jgi:hypothetical protein